MPMVSFHLEPGHIPWTLYKSKLCFQTTMSDIMIFDDFARHKNLKKHYLFFENLILKTEVFLDKGKEKGKELQFLLDSV